MNKPKKVTREETYYVQTCSICGEEFRIDKNGEEIICYDCAANKALNKAIEEGQFLIGAEIIKLEPMNHGHLTDIDELASLTVKTEKGQIIEFSVAGWDEHYIEWEEVQEESV